jgi:hypothetical protein
MKKLLTIGFIVTYLGALNYGIGCHMLGHGTGAHPLMYFIVWDMFCGWSAYDSRMHIIAEGENQKYYDVATPPWRELLPWGHLGRQHYDAFNNHTGRVGRNILKHTRHEPITRMFVVEENWAKKYNVPDAVWRARNDGPKEPHKYYLTRTVLLPDGTVTRSSAPWLQLQSTKMLGDNPRLQVQASKSRSLFLINQEKPGRDMLVNPLHDSDGRRGVFSPVGAPLGN